MKYQASMKQPPTAISGRRSNTRSAPALRRPRARTARRGVRERGWILPSQAGSSRVSAIGRTTREALSRSPRIRSEEHTSELQSRGHLVCRLLLEKKKLKPDNYAFLLLTH